MDQKAIRIDNIDWWVYPDKLGIRRVQPLCPLHHLRMYPSRYSHMNYDSQAIRLRCEDCSNLYNLPRSYGKEEQYVLDRIDAEIFKGMKFINLDDEALPIARDKSLKDSKYFITSLLTKSKTGLRLVVYAGEKGKKRKHKSLLSLI